MTATDHVAGWLETVHEGYGRFADSLHEYGVECESDLRAFDEEDLKSIRDLLCHQHGARALHWKTIERAIREVRAQIVVRSS